MKAKRKPRSTRVASDAWLAAAQHQANEWADTATNGLQWLRNIKDGISTVDEAIAALESDIKYCRLIAAN